MSKLRVHRKCSTSQFVSAVRHTFLRCPRTAYSLAWRCARHPFPIVASGAHAPQVGARRHPLGQIALDIVRRKTRRAVLVRTLPVRGEELSTAPAVIPIDQRHQFLGRADR